MDTYAAYTIGGFMLLFFFFPFRLSVNLTNWILFLCRFDIHTRFSFVTDLRLKSKVWVTMPT